MLEIKNLSAGYPGINVLNGVNMVFGAGEVTVILGSNGCGKSTLLKALCGILPVSGGEMTLDGQDLMTLSGKKLAQNISYLPQNRQIPDITVQRLVLHGRFPYLGYPRHYRMEDYIVCQSAMEQMGILEWADIPLAQLSGGQRQKVYIAMALAQNTPVILLDEPTTYLDVNHQMQMMRHAKELAGQGKTVVMVIHDLSHGLQVADRIVLMQDGRTVTAGTAEEIYASGLVDTVFGVKLSRVKVDDGWRYYYE